MSFIIYFEDFTQLLFWCAVTLGNVCIVVKARAGAKGCVILVRADSAVINNIRNASVSTVNHSLSTL